MGVRTVDHAERDISLANRETRPVDAVTGEDQLHALRTRIRAGLNSPPPVDPRAESLPACRACYQRGYMAALQHLLEE
jgi:hypothetical protein